MNAEAQLRQPHQLRGHIWGDQIRARAARDEASARVEGEFVGGGDAGLAIRLYKSVCHELAATRSLLVTVGKRSAIERLAAFLVTLHRRTASNGSSVVKLAMRRSDIADLLGLTIETVSRTFTKLREMGVIEVEQGGTFVHLCDLPRLTELANE